MDPVGSIGLGRARSAADPSLDQLRRDIGGSPGFGARLRSNDWHGGVDNPATCAEFVRLATVYQSFRQSGTLHSGPAACFSPMTIKFSTPDEGLSKWAALAQVPVLARGAFFARLVASLAAHNALSAEVSLTMALTVISEATALLHVAEALRLPATDTASDVSLPLIGQSSSSRAAHILAPCPRHELERARTVPVAPRDYFSDPEQLASRTADALDALLAYGDILEMQPPRRMMSGLVSPLVVRPAPPAFVARKVGSMIILGVAGDEITPPIERDEQAPCMAWRTPILAPEGPEPLGPFLKELGLIELFQKRPGYVYPPLKARRAIARAWVHRLADAAPASIIEGLQVLDTRKSPTFLFRSLGRTAQHRQWRMHIGRRPQRYGAPLWCLVDLVGRAFLIGSLILLYAASVNGTPCDLAWRIQMAMDVLEPARRSAPASDTKITKLYLTSFHRYPLGQSAKLAVVGERIGPHRSFLSYMLPPSEVDEIIQFMHDYLWITPENVKPEGSNSSEWHRPGNDR